MGLSGSSVVPSQKNAFAGSRSSNRRLTSRWRGSHQQRQLSERSHKSRKNWRLLVLVTITMLLRFGGIWQLLFSSHTFMAEDYVTPLSSVALPLPQQHRQTSLNETFKGTIGKGPAMVRSPFTIAHHNQTTLSSFPRPLSSAKQSSIPPKTIAYAVSLIQCSNIDSNGPGLSDAALVLRHSIHQNSVRNPGSGSRYDYRMIAIVHPQAVECAQWLERASFEIVIRDTPIHPTNVEAPFLKKRMHRALCCGHNEFIKLYAYTLTEFPVVVHMDIDFVITKPLDDLFDVLTQDKERMEAAKQRIELQDPAQGWPQEPPQAFFTRDWAAAIPGKVSGYQAGFIALVPNPVLFDDVVKVIQTTNFIGGFSRRNDNGWGGLGYGSFIGDMAMQGAMAYYYDQFRPTEFVELNMCAHNHMGMKVTVGRNSKCKNNKPTCENCQHTPLSRIHSIHYTACRKPWNCIGEGRDVNPKGRAAFEEPEVVKEHCLELVKVWHNYRKDLEERLLAVTGDEKIRTRTQVGTYKPDVFQGHCHGNGGEHYLSLSAGIDPTTLSRMKELYN